MNLRERLELRAVINMIISIIERLVSLFDRAQKKLKPKIDDPTPVKPNRPKPLKRVVDTIDNIIPLPWRDKK
jgi:hypothetical protein